MTIFTSSHLVLNYYLSKSKTKVVYLIVFSALIQIVGIWLRHNTILEVIGISILSVLLMFLGLIFYSIYDRRYGRRDGVNSDPIDCGYPIRVNVNQF